VLWQLFLPYSWKGPWESEYLDEEQVIALYNKVRTGKRTWPTASGRRLRPSSTRSPSLNYWIHNVNGLEGLADARGRSRRHSSRSIGWLTWWRACCA